MSVSGASPGGTIQDPLALMQRAVRRADHSRLLAPPNPWVGAVVVAADGTSFEGSTQRPGEAHAERVALARAGDRARGATLVVTLEPCSHQGRTSPCVEAVIAAGVDRVIVGVLDPDPRVAGRGVAALRNAGIDVTVGVGADLVEKQLEPYLHQRRTGRPYVVLKLAATLDGRVAAPDGSSQWITSTEARLDAHRVRAESDAILVGAGTVRADNPRLTVRGVVAPDEGAIREPLRVVLGQAPEEAAVRPCMEVVGTPVEVLERLEETGAVQVMIEGGAHVAAQFHKAGLVNRYVLYLAPALMGGNDGRSLLAGSGAATMADVWRGTIESVVPLGPDLRIDVLPGS